MNDPVSVQKLYRWHENAAAAANTLALPDAWQTGREALEGAVAINPKIEAAAEVALSVATTEEGDVLQISIADVGSFLHDNEAIRKYADRGSRQFVPEAQDRGASGRLLPSGVGWYVLGLSGQDDRPAITLRLPVNETGRNGPATITRDIVRPRHLTHSHAADILSAEQADESRVGLEGLKRVTNMLAASRGAAEIDTPEAIVGEALHAAEQAMGEFMQANNVPGLYPRQSPSGAVLECTWSPQSTATGRAAWRAPLRELAAFINHCNVTAFLDHRPYPYPAEELEAMVQNLNRNTLEARMQPLITEVQEVYQGAWEEAEFSAEKLFASIGRSAVDPLDLAIAMFAASGRMSEIHKTQEAAARFIAASPHLAGLVLRTALAHNALVFVASDAEAGRSLIFGDGAREAYSYGDIETFGLLESDVDFIGRVAGISGLKPGMKQQTAKLVPRPAKHGAASTGRPANTKRTGAPSQPAKSTKKPQHSAADSAALRRAEAFANPRMALHARMMTAGCKAPAFTFENPGECTATIVDPDGTTYTVTVPGKDDKITRNRASAALLAKIPPLPLNKRGEMWQGNNSPEA